MTGTPNAGYSYPDTRNCTSTESADYLEIILPPNPAERAALFAIGARVMRDTDSCFDPAEEEGQASFTIGW